MSERFCVDCRFAWPRIEAWECRRPVEDERPRDPVTGYVLFPACSSERSNADACGRDAVYFEARP